MNENCTHQWELTNFKLKFVKGNIYVCYLCGKVKHME